MQANRQILLLADKKWVGLSEKTEENGLTVTLPLT